ncbi:Suppressor protein stp22 of temperature-sensitive alpha-factor receptor and arginine permease [Paramarasmius palmivorus]|uniref:Suppressor protein stp22 of temperature-sensitive alpha-factor receptor and arginine permease n=1 Tax=Paramarasmius palmivorus TaxID=297713 RepID=A0AAW0DSS7_9AGAR
MPVYVKPKQRPGMTSTMSTTTATSVSASPPPRPPPPTTQHGAQHGPVQPPPPLPPSQTSSPLRPPPPPPQPYVSQSPYVSPPPLSPQSTGHPPPPPPPLPPLQPVVSPPPQPQNAPPRPINPELLHLHAQIHQKLTSELHSLQTSFVLDAERLRGHQTALLEGEKAIRDEMGRLEAVKGVCQTVAGRYRSTIEECERNLGQVKSRWGDQGEVSVDEVICATSIVDDQLITLVAEDNAIEDTIYHLSRLWVQEPRASIG